jgi:biotin carboxyl carrier protein
MIHHFAATLGERLHQLTVEPLDDGKWRVTIDGRARVLDARRVESGTWSLVPDGGGRAQLVDLVAGAAGELTASVRGHSFAIKLGDARQALSERAAPRRAAKGPQPVRAPMPGKVIKVLVKPGDAVAADQGVLVVEAMKMETELRAPREGAVVDVNVKEGQAVEGNQVLLTIA